MEVATRGQEGTFLHGPSEACMPMCFAVLPPLTTRAGPHCFLRAGYPASVQGGSGILGQPRPTRVSSTPE